MQTSQKLKTNNQYQENQADFWRPNWDFQGTSHSKIFNR
jgi:hypothetical protein